MEEYNVTQLIAQEDFIAFRSRKNIESYIVKCVIQNPNYTKAVVLNRWSANHCRFTHSN